MRETRMIWVIGMAVFGVGLGLYAFNPAKTVAQPPAGGGAAGGPKYSVVETDGSNLLVVDNSTNMMHYYTIDQDKDIGTELKLRGSVDLTEVGKPIIIPKLVKAD